MTLKDIEEALEQLDPTVRLMVQFLRSMLQEQESRLVQQQETIEQLTLRIAELTAALYGKKSEKVPSARREAEKKAREQESAEQKAERKRRTQRRRKKAREQRKTLPTESLECPMPTQDLVCPKCEGTDFKQVGDGHHSIRYEVQVQQVVRQLVKREVWACACGECLLTAPPPPQVTEGSHYGPQFYAHVAVAKCADSIPLTRLAKAMRRAGMPIQRSTLCDIFHRNAELLRPLYDRMAALVRVHVHVNADETRLKIQQKGGCRTGWVWTFIAGKMVLFTYSSSRSGETPKRILGDSPGTLQVDQYTGYNQVTTPGKRDRAGCWAHARRRFFNALETAPEPAGHIMDLLGELYVVEHVARDKDIVGTAAHSILRNDKSKPVISKLRAYIDKQMPLHPPKSPMGKALRYAHNNWTSLTVFLDDPDVHIDNNVAERALRIVALGRKNFLFAGNDGCAQNLAVLQTLVSTCNACGVNPQDYLADVLIRIQDTPMSRIDELLPMNWGLPDTG